MPKKRANLTYFTCLPHEIDEITHKKLQKLRIRGGLIVSKYNHLRKVYRDSLQSKDLSGHLCICQSGSNILGWGLLYDNSEDTERNFIMIYVKKRYRRRGIGSKICEYLAQFGDPQRKYLNYYGHNQSAIDFFRNTGYFVRNNM